MQAPILFLLAALASCGSSPSSSSTLTPSMTTSASETTAAGTVYDYSVKTIDGKDMKLSQFAGKKLLIVNVASECGYTPQYKELEELHQKHGDKVTVLGFPANNFGGQEPGTNEEIATFCEKNFGVTFPMFEKVSVKGDDTAPLYQFLADKTKNGAISDAPTWNFCKYLVDEQGHVVGFYPSKVKPMSDELVAAILK